MLIVYQFSSVGMGALVLSSSLAERGEATSVTQVALVTRERVLRSSSNDGPAARRSAAAAGRRQTEIQSGQDSRAARRTTETEGRAVQRGEDVADGSRAVDAG